MNITAIGSQTTQIIAPLTRLSGQGPAAQPEGPDFGKVISDAIQRVDSLQKQADEASIQVATGQSTDLSSALVSVEEANLALQLTMQVRNKLVESYQEIMRMQV